MPRLHEGLWHVIIATQSAYSIAARSSEVVPNPEELATTATPELLLRALKSPMTSPLRDLDIVITEGRHEGRLGSCALRGRWMCNLHCRDLLFTAELRWHVSAGWVQILFRSRATQFYSIEHFQFPGYMPKLIGKSDSIASLSLAVAYGKSRPAYTRWRVQSLPRKFFGRWWLDLSWSGGRSTQCQTYAMPLTCRCTTRAADSNDRHHMASSPVRYG